MEKTMAPLVPKVLTGIKAPPTKGTPQITISKRFKRLARFETRGNPQLERLLDASANFVASVNYVWPPFWLTLSGKSGIGKTHLAKAVRKQFMDQNRFETFWDHSDTKIKGNTEWFCDWRKFADDIRSGGYDRLVEDAIDEWFVIIDDFGAERDPSGFVAAAADRIFNGRRDKWTFITTNLSLKAIGERMDVRIASRLIRGANQFVEVEAEDYAI